MKDFMTKIQREQCRLKKIQWKVAACVFDLDVLTFWAQIGVPVVLDSKLGEDKPLNLETRNKNHKDSIFHR